MATADALLFESDDAIGRRKAVTLVLLLALALLVRGWHLAAVSDTPLMAYHRHFTQSDMYVFDEWARRIAGGDVLGREVYHPIQAWQERAAPPERWREWYGTAPVFFKSPFYPYLLAVLAWLFGDPALPAMVLQALVSAGSVVLLFLATEAMLGATAGTLAALWLALYAPAIHFDAVLLRGPFIVVAELAVAFALVRLGARPSRARAALVGAAVGVALVVNEGFLLLPVLALLPVALWAGRRRRVLSLALAYGLGLLLALAPVVARNVAVGVPPFKLAVTGSVVYAVFNVSGSSPYVFEFHPAAFVPVLEQGGGRLLPTALACLRTFPGPAAVAAFYARRSVSLLVPYESPDNVSFYYAALKDPLLSWLPAYGLLLPMAALGFALSWRRLARLLPLAPTGLALLVPILLSMPLSRYRVTLVVHLMPFAGLALGWLAASLRAKRWRRVLAAAAGLLALAATARTIETRAVFAGKPAALFYRRPSDFWVSAEILAATGRPAQAAQEALWLARLNPDRTIKRDALLLAAQNQVRAGDLAAARQALAVSGELASGDPLALLHVGDAYVEWLHDAAAGQALYARAAALPHSDELARALLTRTRSTPLP